MPMGKSVYSKSTMHNLRKASFLLGFRLKGHFDLTVESTVEYVKADDWVGHLYVGGTKEIERETPNLTSKLHKKCFTCH